MILNKCCCCIELKTGALVISVLSIDQSITGIVLTCWLGAQQKDHTNAVFMITLFVFLSLSIISLVMSSLLVHGVRKERPALILPWLIHEFISLLVFYISFIMHQYYALLIIMIVNSYFCICVLSYYQELKEKTASGAVQRGGNEDGKEQSLA